MGLPRPVSVTDEYLAAVLDALGEIRDRLPAPKAEPQPGPVKVSEPARSTGKTARGGRAVSETKD